MRAKATVHAAAVRGVVTLALVTARYEKDDRGEISEKALVTWGFVGLGLVVLAVVGAWVNAKLDIFR